jgi:hypothetical protein
MADEPARPAHWPEDVDPLYIEDFQKLGRNEKNELFWDGKPLVTKSQYIFTGYQIFLSVLAIIASIATIATGLNDTSVFLCGRDVRLLSCPVPESSQPIKIILQLPPAATQPLKPVPPGR